MRKLLLLAAAAGMCAAEVHQIKATAYYRTFSARHPVLKRVKSGDKVVTKTLDSGGQDEKGARLGEQGNPLTGPFYVEGAEPGDALIVHFDRVRPNRNWGYTGFRLGLVSLAPESIEKLHSDSYKKDLVRPGRDNLIPWDIDLARGTVKPREPKSGRIPLEFKAEPMVGCVGVAPTGDFSPTSGPAGSYGGNLDYNRIGEGATVLLPVYHPGGLLFVGDSHALQGDGEAIGNGVETSMDVEFTVTVKKKAGLTGPRVITADSIISVGAQAEFSSSLDRGLQMATSDMVRWLEQEYGIEPWAAHLLVGYQGKYEVVTVAGSMALRIPKVHLPSNR
ncbi:MAG: acetamidase [Acidobacteria bacterium]|nr:acetamidase [Acidobacteriota bacterium]